MSLRHVHNRPAGSLSLLHPRATIEGSPALAASPSPLTPYCISPSPYVSSSTDDPTELSQSRPTKLAGEPYAE